MRFTFSDFPGPFMQYLGPLEIISLLIPVALTGLAVCLIWLPEARPAWATPTLWGLGVLCLVYCVVPIWFISEADIAFMGVLFLPAGLALIVSVIAASVSKPTSDDESES